MSNQSTFKRAMHALFLNFNRAPDDDVITLYWRALSDLSDEEFARAIHDAINTDTFFPPIARLRALARPSLATEAQAVALFDRIETLGSYNPTGYRWHVSTIRERLGDAAAEAFVAAGGESAWTHRSERDWPFVRKAFVDAFVPAQLQVERDALSAAHRLPRSSPRTLTAGVSA